LHRSGYFHRLFVMLSATLSAFVVGAMCFYYLAVYSNILGWILSILFILWIFIMVFSGAILNLDIFLDYINRKKVNKLVNSPDFAEQLPNMSKKKLTSISRVLHLRENILDAQIYYKENDEQRRLTGIEAIKKQATAVNKKELALHNRK